MRKKRIILKRSISALVIGAVTISILAGATSASSSVNADDATASVAVFENLLNDRSFVVDTFTQDTMPESNPYGRLDGVANTDYLSTDFLKQYENDPIFKSGVSLYYRMNHTGETISEIPSVLLDVFATDADWTKFCAGAKSKNYDSLLTSIYQNDYKSVSGNSIGSEEEGMQTLRAYSDLLDNSKTKDASKWLNDYLGAITDVNDIDKYNYLLKNTELYDENLTKYVSNVKKTLLQASKNSDGKKEMKDFSDLYEAQFYADYGAGDIPQKWDDQYKTMQIDKYGSKIKKIAKSVKTVISTGVSTVNNIVMMENLYRNQESMHDTLVRVRSNATKNNDNTFIRASSSYLSLLESDELGDNVIRSAALKSIYDYGSDELGKYVWDTAKGGVRDEAAIMVARKTGMDTLSSKMAVSAAVGRANAILAVGKDLINYGTGFDDVCEKIYLMKYLQEIKQYAVDAFNDDKNNYNKYKSQADMKNMDIWASAAIDDLQFIKRIVLLQNDLGYQTANAQIGSKYGEILSWIDGCNDAAGLEARYTNLQNALVDTTINPVSTNPISVDEGCTLQIIHSTDSDLQTYAVYTNRSGQKCSIAEFENVMLAGIRINGGTLKISDQSKEEMKFNGLFVTDKAGNLEITGNGGEIYVGRLDINGFLQINDKCSKKINVASNLNIRNYVSIKNMDIHVAGNCNVAGSLEFASSELVVDGNMEADNGYLQMQDTEDKLLVKGNLTLGETYGSSKGECLTNGTVEVKGDFTSNYKETGSNWYGYYETNMHKTIFSGEKTQKISFKEPSQVNGFNDNLELQNNAINFATPLYSLTVNNDMAISKTKDLQIVTQLIINNGSFVTTGNVEANMLYINNTKENQIQGNLNMTGTVVFKKGSLEVRGNAKFDNGYLQMQDTEDKLLVKGNLTLGETYGSSKGECLTNGTVEVKGDFTSNYKETGSNWYGYYETNTHKTIFSGEKTQKISFKEASQVNGFSDKLELQNNDINFATPIYNVKINQDTQLTNTEKLMITGTLNTGGYKFATTGNIDAERLDMGGAGVEIAGDVAVRIMNVSGSDNLIKGNLMANGGGAAFKQGSLEVGGNAEFNNGFLQMQDTEDKLLVKGNLTLGETYGSSKGECLTNGTVEVKGDFTSNYKETGSNWYGYYETNMHKTIFSGEKTQKISFKEPSQVNGFNDNLELQNNAINFATPLYSLTVNNDMAISKTKDLQIVTQLIINNGSFVTTGNVEANMLYINNTKENQIQGNLNMTGTVVFKKGSLEVRGNAKFDNGYLQMQDTEDKLLVKGNLTLGETYGSSKGECLTNGTVEVKGDFTSNYKETGSNWYGYYETNTHKTIFSGENTQKISFKEASQVNGFSDKLELQNNDINFATPIYNVKINQDTQLTNTEKLMITGTLNTGGYKFATTGNIDAERLDMGGAGVEIAGDVAVRTMNVSGSDNLIKGNLMANGGGAAFKQGSLEVGGNAEFNNGFLQMQDTEDKLLVKGNLALGETYGSSKGECLTNGTVEVKGDFTSNYKETGSNWYGYYETNMHKTIFSGEKTQKISFKEPSRVNRFSENLELQNTDINFATPLYSLTLNQDTVLIHTDLLKINEFLNLNGHKLATTGKTECSNVAENGGTLEENPKFGHNYYNQLKPADLKDHDIKYADEAWVCTSCGKIFTDAEGIVEYDPDPCKDGHTIVIDQGKAATCTTDGLTEGKHCSVCKTVLVPQEVIPASHNWEEDFTIDKEPSCTTEGRKSIHCKKCGETKDEQVIPATDHDFTEWETIAETSCTKEGITQRRCKICGFIETKKLDKKAHEWGTEYTVDQPATFAADGSKSIHCKNCETISEAIAIPRINSVKISATAYTYSGGVKTPSVTVKDANGNALHNKTDYIVQYASGRKNVGTYKVIVTLKDNYSGKKTLSFTINPKGTTISSLSKTKKAFTAKWKKQSAQTSGYQLLYSTNSKFKSRNKYVTVSSYKTTSKTIKKLAAKKKYYVKIRTYKSVSGKKYYSGWSAAKTVVTK